MATAVRLIEEGGVDTGTVVGEVFDMEHIDEALSLLARDDPTRDAVRVGLRHKT